MTKVAAFDLETASTLEEAGNDYGAMGITCAAVHLTNRETYMWTADPVEGGGYAPRMSEARVNAMIRDLIAIHKSGFPLVTWNGVGFDMRVLYESTEDGVFKQAVAMMTWEHYDPFYQACGIMGYGPGLNALAIGLGASQKTEGMDGLQAISMWQEGPEAQRKVVDYVVQDAVSTMAVFKVIDKNPVLRWTSKKGRPQTMYLTERVQPVKDAIDPKLYRGRGTPFFNPDDMRAWLPDYSDEFWKFWGNAL